MKKLLSNVFALCFCLVFATPTPPDRLNATASISDVPSDVWTNLLPFLGVKPILYLGQTNHAFRNVTLDQRKMIHNLIEKGRTNCDLKFLLRTTDNGYSLFESSLKFSGFYDLSRIFNGQAHCVYSFVHKPNQFDQLSDLVIYLPSFTHTDPDANGDLYSSLNLLFRVKKHFRSIIVEILTDDLSSQHLNENMEIEILRCLMKANVDSLVLDFKIRNLPAFKIFVRHASVKRISFLGSDEEINDELVHLQGLEHFTVAVQDEATTLHLIETLRAIPTLTSLTIPGQSLAHINVLDHIVDLKIVAPADRYSLVSLIQSGRSIRRLDISDLGQLHAPDIIALISLNRGSLISLSLLIDFSFVKAWNNVLSSFLTNNAAIKELSLDISQRQFNTTVNLVFFNHAVELTSFTLIDTFTDQFFTSDVFSFISGHSSLHRVSLILIRGKSTIFENFLHIFHNLVEAVQRNQQIKLVTVKFVFRIPLESRRLLMDMISEECEKLVGRGLKLNGVPVENVVRDLHEPLEANLLDWDNILMIG